MCVAVCGRACSPARLGRGIAWSLAHPDALSRLRALREGVFGQALVERFDEELDRATGALLSDLRQLTHANMVEEIEVFSHALELDLIGPSDFQLSAVALDDRVGDQIQQLVAPFAQHRR